MKIKRTNLQAELGQRHWNVYSDGNTQWQTTQFDAAIGNLPIDKFGSYRISAISDSEITIENDYNQEEKYRLTPGATIVISYGINGREWSDGCVYDGNSYTLKLTW